MLDDSRAPFYRWFAGGRLNTCYNALDRHVERGRADQPALVYDSPVTETIEALDAGIGMVEAKPQCCIVLQRPMLEADLDPGRDVEWNDALAGVEPAECVSVEATEPLYVLYTSGTTGQPKGSCATTAATRSLSRGR